MTNYYKDGRNYLLNCPTFEFENLKNINFLDFLRGYIELNSSTKLPDLSLNNFSIHDIKPQLFIYFRKEDKQLLDYIHALLINEYKISCSIKTKRTVLNQIKYSNYILFENYNMLYLLSLIYSNITVDKNSNEIDDYLYSIYMNLSNFQYITYDQINDTLNTKIPKCYFKLLSKSALPPIKLNISDIGYNINIIKRYKTISNKTIIYDTGLEIKVDFGYIIDIKATSELIKKGYILSHYDIEKNKLLITLTKVDDELPDIKLPFNGFTMILKKYTHYECHSLI